MLNAVYNQDAIIETIDEAIIIFRKYMPLSEYDLYVKLLGVRDTLTARRDAERQRYQDKADYHRKTSQQWRKDNKEHAKAYHDKWNGTPCKCPDKDMGNWRIIGSSKQKNPETPKPAYLVKCVACGSQWRTKAKYCRNLKDERQDRI